MNLKLFLSIGISMALLAGCSSSKEEPDTIIVDDSDSDTTATTPTVTATSLTLVSSNAHNITLLSSSGTYTLTLIDSDPYIFSGTLASAIPSDRKMLEFEYTTDTEINDLQIFYAIGGQVSEANSKKYGALSATSTYATFTADISSFRDDGWGKAGDFLRIDPGDNGGITMHIRNIKVRTMTDAEQEAADELEQAELAKEQMAANLEEYLSTEYSSSVSSVVVTRDQVTITGTCGSTGTYVLADICPWQDITEMDEFPYTESISNGSFSVTVDRTVTGREGINYDRVFSKWAVVKVVDDTTMTLDSHARYADEVAKISSPAALTLKNKKGLGAGDIDLYFQDCEDMNVGSITMNVLLNGIVEGVGSDYSYGGINYSTGGTISYCDNIVSKASDLGISVAAIILTPTGSAYQDPENDGGYYSMPNLTTAKAFNMYAAALTYMASRYCKDDPGRIHNWIMHNEVDMGTTWTNMGTQPMMRFLDRYVKSMRICYNIVRQYDQNASVMASFTHNWTTSDGGYAPKEMLEGLVAYSNAEGDFWWGVAYHPYPEDLTKSDYWVNDVNSTYSLNSKYVTFKNMEVLDKWIQLSENLYNGEKKRLLYFSEQGTNSPSYSDYDLAHQAAGGALAWKKLELLDGVDAMQWHNWADNTAEYGLRIGLRTFEESPYANLDPKPVWYVWNAAGTSDESSVFDQYLDILGLSSWDKSEIIHNVN